MTDSYKSRPPGQSREDQLQLEKRERERAVASAKFPPNVAYSEIPIFSQYRRLLYEAEALNAEFRALDDITLRFGKADGMVVRRLELNLVHVGGVSMHQLNSRDERCPDQVNDSLDVVQDFALLLQFIESRKSRLSCRFDKIMKALSRIDFKDLGL